VTYGQCARASNEPTVVQRALERASGSWGGYQAWHRLDPESRLDLVEQALSAPANDLVDDLPLAL
jgi:hypothetical protein